MSRKFALVIGNTEYIDPGLAQLSAPGKDAEDLAGVLRDPDFCGFDHVNIMLNQISSTVVEAIDEFFDQKKPDDLLILYFSGHGVRDEFGTLYLAVSNTIRTKLRSTAIRSDYIREAMDQSRSKRQVLILDCCNSGAFPQGTKAEVGGAMGMTRAFQGYGRFVLTASDSTQFAWEGNKVIGETENSLFTHFLVKGLRGEADRESDGRITVDELYDYAYGEISKVTPKQTPTKSSSKQEGEIILRQITRLEDIKPVALPDDLINEMEDTRPYVREVAVQKLEKIVRGRNIGMARSAREGLEKLVADDNTTRRVSLLATQILDSILQAEKEEEERKAREEAERLRVLKEEEERLAREKAEAERKALQEAEQLAAKAKAERKAQREAQRIALQRENEERVAREKAEQEREAQEKVEAERLAVQAAETERVGREKVKRERVTQEKIDVKRLAAKKAKEERDSQQKQQKREQTEAAPFVSAEIAQPRPVVPQRTLYTIGIVGMIVVFGLIAMFVRQRNAVPVTGLEPTETEERAVATATVERTPEATSLAALQSPLATTAIVETPSQTPSLASIPGVETFAYVASSRVYLYKGPELRSDLAVQLAYPRGEKLTVLGRNQSGLWFLCEAADGNQGWLYRDWLDLDVDPLGIPTASFIPTLRPTDRPAGGGGGGGGATQAAPTCVFC